MARCSEIEQELQAYIDNELDRTKALIVEEHIANCVHCKNLFEEYRKVNAILHESFYPYRLCESLDSYIFEKIPTRDKSFSYEKSHDLTLKVKMQDKPRFLFTKLIPYFAVALIAVLGTYIFLRWPSIIEPHHSGLGYIVAIEDRAFLTQGETTKKISKEKPIQLTHDSYIETTDKGFCLIGFVDDTVIKLSQNTKINIVDNRSIKLDRGKIFCEVSSSSRPFIINTDQGQITVLGTKFQVELKEGKLITTVVSGEVRVEANRKFAIVKSNCELIVQNKEISGKAKRCDANLITQWATKISYPNIFEFRNRIEAGINLPQPVSKVYVVPIDHKKISALVVEWDKLVSNNSNYTIYVYDEELKPLLRYKIPKELLTQHEGSLNIPMPEEIRFEDMGLIHIEILSDDIDRPNVMPFTRVYAKS